MIIEILGFDNYIFSEKYYTLPLMFYVPQSNYAISIWVPMEKCWIYRKPYIETDGYSFLSATI